MGQIPGGYSETGGSCVTTKAGEKVTTLVQGVDDVKLGDTATTTATYRLADVNNNSRAVEFYSENLKRFLWYGKQRCLLRGSYYLWIYRHTL